MNHTCWLLHRRLEQQVLSASTAVTISSSSPSLTSPPALVHPDRARLAALGDDLPGAGLELVLDASRPTCTGAITTSASLLPTSLSTRELLCQATQDGELVVLVHGDGPVRDLDVVHPELVDRAHVLVQLVLAQAHLEQRPAEADGHAVRLWYSSTFSWQVWASRRRCPSRA